MYTCKGLLNATRLNSYHQFFFNMFFEDLLSTKKINQNCFWHIFGLQFSVKICQTTLSLPLIVGLDVTVGILLGKDIFSRNFILCAVATVLRHVACRNLPCKGLFRNLLSIQEEVKLSNCFT